MKFIICLALSVAMFVAGGITSHEVFNNDDSFNLIVAVISSLVTFILLWINIKINKTTKEAIVYAISTVKSTSDEIASKIDEKNANYLAIAEDEINQNKVDKGLWSQALIKANGNESLRKIEYMKLRARQLKN